MARSARNATYRLLSAHISAGIYATLQVTKTLQIASIDNHVPPLTGLIAMQKVEGSNPFSRFARKPAPRAGFCFSGQPWAAVVAMSDTSENRDERPADLHVYPFSVEARPQPHFAVEPGRR